MKSLDDRVSEWLPDISKRLGAHVPQVSLEYVGHVQAIGDGVATVSGLPYAKLGEVIRFEDEGIGLVFRVDRESLGCVLLAGGETITAGSRSWGTGQVFRVPVGETLLGRVVDPTGEPIDGGAPLEPTEFMPVDREAPAIVDRDLVHTPLETGLIAIDSMIPLGRGQRELIIGDRKTGKTAIAVDSIINQRNTDFICIYAAVGQKSSSVNQVISAVQEHGAFGNCIFVIGPSNAPAGAQWITPFAACTMAEYFRDRGQDVLLVIDDLTKHAVIYRELSLLLRRPPGREAYPGDIFYVHARLLERAARLSDGLGGGSLTALPIAETQAGNLTAYIPTNLISITDGQIMLDTKLFYEGQRPAVDVGLSVSRVGGKTQPALIKQLAETLRLDYAQFLELEVFARFGAMVDERTRRTLDHGERIRAILSQQQYAPLSVTEQAAMLLLLNRNGLDGLKPASVSRLRDRIRAELSQKSPRLAGRIESDGNPSEEDIEELFEQAQAILKGMDETG